MNNNPKNTHNNKLIKPCVTQSLRQYLAHQSVHSSEEVHENSNLTFEIELDNGDGHKEVLCIGSATNIEQEAALFCQRHNLKPFVQKLLAQSIREQYQNQITEHLNQKQAQKIEQLRDVYANSGAKEVLLGYSSQQKKMLTLEKETETFESHLKDSVWRKTQIGQANKENNPTINAVSRMICEKYGKKNIIQLRNKRSKERLEAIKSQKLEKQVNDMNECLFHPKINSISQKVDRQLVQNSSVNDKKIQRYELLYQNHHQLEAKKNQLKQDAIAEISFKPQINFISRKIVQGRKLMNSTVGCEELRRSKHLNCREQEKENRPKTGRKPLNRNTGGLPIGEYLYQKANRRHSKPQIMKNQIKALQHSDYLVSVLKEKKLKEIFVELSRPPHTCLNPDDIPPLDLISQEPLLILLPLLKQMTQIGVSLSEQDFMQAGLGLIATLTPQERYGFMFKKYSPQSGNPSFGSTQIKGFARHDSGNLYSRGLTHTRQKQQRMDRIRQERVRQELKTCTFHPLITQ